MSDFREMVKIEAILEVRKNFKLLKHKHTSYISLKRVIWRFQIYNLFREISKFREDKGNNKFREILKCFRKTAKFEFFAKQMIYLESPDHALQTDYMICLCFKSLNFFELPNGIKFDHFAKMAHKIVKSKYFSGI